MLETVLLLLVSYLIGSIPTGYILGKVLKGIDIRTLGSGNIGATNVWRALGPVPALAALAGDITKGIVAVLLGRHFGPPGFELATAAAALIGHGWSVFLRFRGGKMIATLLGVLLMLPPVGIAVAAVIWLSLTALTRYVSLASMTAAVAVPIAFAATGADLELVLFTAAAAAVVVYKHRDNIARLIDGTEHKFGFRK